MQTQAISAAVAASGGAATAAQSPASAASFNQALERAGAAREVSESGPASWLDPLLNLNSDSARLTQQAQDAASTDMRPGELMMLTMRSHEFLFHCQLVSNVANRSADGMQQLFRQQA